MDDENDVKDERRGLSVRARIFDIHNRFVYEGKAIYRRDEEMVYLRADEDIEKRGPGFIVHFMDDNHGVFDFRCMYNGYERDGLQYIIALEVAETVQTIQRREDVKARTNIPVKVGLLDFDGKVKIDPETMKSVQFQAYLRDISAGGVMIDSPFPLEINQKIMFPFDKGSVPILINAEVIREQPQEDAYYRYGCRYLNNNSGKESVIREYVFRLQLAGRDRTAYSDLDL